MSTPPTFDSIMEDGGSVSLLGAFENERAAVWRDAEGDWWISDHPTGNYRRMTEAQMIDLAGFLCDQLGLVVLNPHPDWGLVEQTCDCVRVPAEVECVDCNQTLILNSEDERPEWKVNTDGSS